MGIYRKPITKPEVEKMLDGLELEAGTGIPHVSTRSNLPTSGLIQDELYYIENENKLVAWDVSAAKFEETGITIPELDVRYYSKSQVDALIASIEPGTGESVDSYTKSEIDAKLLDFVVDGTVYLKEEVYNRSEVDSLLANAGVVDAYSKDETYTKTEVDNLIANVDAGSGGTPVDAYTKGETDNLLANKADSTSVYTKSETNTLLNGKMDFDNAYTKSDADWRFVINGSLYTNEEIDSMIANISGGGTSEKEVEMIDMFPNFPQVGEANKIYVDMDKGKIYMFDVNAQGYRELGLVDSYLKSETYSKEEVDGLLEAAGSVDAYSKAETDNMLANKSDINHTHSEFSQLHTHSNKTVLDNLKEFGGTLQYKDKNFIQADTGLGSDAREVVRTMASGDIAFLPAVKNSVVDVRYINSARQNVNLIPVFKNANATPWDDNTLVNVSASAYYDSGTMPWRAFDNTASYIWNSKYKPTEQPVWIQVDFGLPRKVKTFDIGITASMQTRAPSKFNVAVSDDGVNFNVVQTYSGIVWSSSAETKYFTIDEANRKSAKIIRLNFLENGDGGSVAITQINMQGDVSESVALSPTTDYSLMYDTERKGYILKHLGTDSKNYSVIIEEPSILASYNPQKALNVRNYYAAGDGVTDDSSVIQSVLDKSEQDGVEIVYFPSGTYLLNTGLIIPSNTTLLFEKGATLKRGLPFTTMMLAKSDGTATGYNGPKNIKLIGGVFDANGTDKLTTFALGHADSVVVEFCTFKGNADWHMIDCAGSSNVRISNNKFLNYGTSSTGTEAIQLDVFLPPPASNGNFPWYGSYDGTACMNVTIEGNYFENGNTAIGSHSAAVGSFHKNIKILNNMFINHRLEAIIGLSWSDTIIEGNYFDDALGGIKLFSISGNTPCKNIKIRKNTLKNIKKGTTSRGIYLASLKNDSIIQDIVIEDNFLESINHHGISFDYSKNVSVKGNRVTGCGQAGVFSYSTDNVLIKDNNLSGNDTQATGIRYDITIGYVSDKLGKSNWVISNFVESLGVSYTKDAIIEQNVFTIAGKTVTDAGGNTNLIATNNRAVSA